MPKKFSARLERGYFDAPMDEKLGKAPRWASKYKSRLVFDKSPCPQAQEWKEVDEDHQYMLPQPFPPYSKWNEFCSVKVPKIAVCKETA